MTSSAIPATGLSRRDFIAVSLAAGGGMLVGFPFSGTAAQTPAQTPAAFIRIDRAGRVTLILPYVEMGQGSYTSQAQILAEELEVSLDTVVLEAAPAAAVYASPIIGEQATGGSFSLRGAWASMRPAAAAARMMLVDAAARRWSVRSNTCRAENGRVIHSSGRSLSYGELADEAANRPVPASPALKAPGAFRVVGQPQKRLDTPAKINGTARFGIDMRPDGVLHAMVQACPVPGGRLSSVDPAPALRVKGVRQVVRIDNAVAVVADHTWAALKGLRALSPRWDEGANRNINTGDLVAAADAALARQGLIALKTGDVAKADAAAARRFEATYRMPMLAHAAMEPLSCTVKIENGQCDVWVGSQIVGRAHKTAAEAAGLPPAKVSIHNQFLGGGFGRRLEADYVHQAVLIAKQVECAAESHLESRGGHAARLLSLSQSQPREGGRGREWAARGLAPPRSGAEHHGALAARLSKDGIDLDAVDAAQGPYDIPNVLVEFSRNEAPAGLNTGNWRGVGPTRNVFVVESAIDELAHAAQRDPIAYRKALMSKAPRARAVLERVERESQWGAPLPEGSGRGVSVFKGFGSHLAMVAQVRVARTGRVSVERIVCAVDTGIAVNPDIVRAQIEGGVIYGLSAVLYGKITMDKGRVQQTNFDTYPVMRMDEAPRIEVHIVQSTADPGGVGEPGTSGAIAAVCNAVFAATGKRVRTLPIDPAQLRST